MAERENGPKWDQKSTSEHAAEIVGPHRRSNTSSNEDAHDISASFPEHLRHHADLPAFDVPGTPFRCFIDNSQEQPMISIGTTESPDRIRMNPHQLTSLVKVLHQTTEFLEQFRPTLDPQQITPTPVNESPPAEETPSLTDFDVIHVRKGFETKPERERRYELVARVRAKSFEQAIEISQRPNWAESKEVLHCYVDKPRLTKPGDRILRANQQGYWVGPDNSPSQSPPEPTLKPAIQPDIPKVDPGKPKHKRTTPKP